MRWVAAGSCGLILAVFATLLGLAVAARAQERDTQALIERLDRLERLLYLSGAAGRPAPITAQPESGATLKGGPIAARMDVRIGAIEGALTEQTGRIEEILHHLESMNARLEKLVADVDYRLSVLEDTTLGGAPAIAGPGASSATTPSLGAAPTAGTLGTITARDLQAVGVRPTPAEGAAAGAASPVVAAVSPPAQPPPPLIQLPPGTPQERYEFARGLLKQARYDEAESAFQQFIAAHGADSLAGNAKYWLAETYYVRGRYKESAETYLDGYQKFPSGVKAPDNLLKLGVSLARLGEEAEACDAFDRLAEAFPDATQPIKQRAQRERARIACP